MASEISAKIGLNILKNGKRIRIDETEISDMDGDKMEDSTQTIGPSATLLELGSVATDTSAAGQLFLRNLTSSTSTLGYIECSVDNTFGATTTFARLKGGQWMKVPLQRNDIYLRSGSGNLLIEKVILDP